MVNLELSKQLGTEHEILSRDLAILGVMVAQISDYLISDAISWKLRGSDTPLTVGGCLMRLNRLSLLQADLVSDECLALARARMVFDEALLDKVVRFEQRAYQELNARLREWTTYMRDLTHSSKLMANRDRYAAKVDTRIVIGELVGKLSEYPYQLDGRVPRDVAALDRRLRLMWQPAEFVLEPVWRKVYPAEPYWWLYGHPKGS
jgi:hypothetical protein